MWSGDPVTDQEGLMSTFPAIVTALLGYWTGLFIQHRGVNYRTVALLAASGWAFLRSRVARKWLPLVVVGLIVGIAVDLWPTSLSRYDASVSPFYQTLAASPHGALLELPPLPRHSDYMAAQIVHQRPILGGYLSRDPVYSIVERVDGLRQLWSADPVPNSTI